MSERKRGLFSPTHLLAYSLTLLALALLASVDPGPTLHVALVDVEEMPLPDLEAITATMDSNGGAGQVPIVCWTGPAYVLWAEGLNGRTGLVEALDENGRWQPYPAPGLQEMLLPGAPPLTNIASAPRRFFRAVLPP